MITMYAPQNNSPQTALVDTISTSATSITVEDASILPGAPNVLTFGTEENAELVLITSKSGNILTVTRGFNGTTAQAWDGGTAVYRAITAHDIKALQDNVKELETGIGTAKTEAIAAAAADATTKATNAESNAKAASIPTTQKGAAGGVATLDSGGKVPTAQIPALNYDPAGSAATAKSEAIAAAALDATEKANAAKSAAIEAASADATSKANNAESNAKAASDPKGSASAVQSNLDSHTGNSNIHVTAADKTNWNGKAGKSTTVTATILAESWTGDAAPYSYSLAVTGITTTSNQEILPALDITAEQLEALQSANIQDGGQASGTVTIKAFGEKPGIDIPIRVILRGDA